MTFVLLSTPSFIGKHLDRMAEVPSRISTESDEPITIDEFLFLDNAQEISTLPAQEVMGNEHAHGHPRGHVHELQKPMYS